MTFNFEKIQREAEGIPEEEPIRTFTVSDAIKLNDGKIKVQGIISSFTQQFKMIKRAELRCCNCNNINADDEFNPPILLIPKMDTKRCINCNTHAGYNVKPDWINVIKITLRNKDTNANMDELTCILFEKNTEDIQTGGLVTVTGDLHVIPSGKKVCLPHLFSSGCFFFFILFYLLFFTFPFFL